MMAVGKDKQHEKMIDPKGLQTLEEQHGKHCKDKKT